MWPGVSVHAVGSPVLRVSYFPNQTLANGATLNLGTGDTFFVLTMWVHNDGDAPLQLGAVTLPTGMSFVVDPSTELLAPGELVAASVVCDATASGQLVIPSNDPAADPFSATLSCSLDGTGTPAMELTAEDGTPIAAGSGSLTVVSGESAQVMIYNRGGGSRTMHMSGVTAAPGDLLYVAGAYGNYGYVAFGGAPTSSRLACEHQQTGEPLMGDFTISVEAEEVSGSYTFTLRCVEAGGLVPAGSDATGRGALLAALLTALGTAGVIVARRRPAPR